MSIDVIARIINLAVMMMFAACGPTWEGGIHARMGYSESGGLRVVEVPEGPARDAGLRARDRIVAIDGTNVDALSEEQVVERLRGRVGTRVTLTVRREGDALERDITVERAPYAARRE